MIFTISFLSQRQEISYKNFINCIYWHINHIFIFSCKEAIIMSFAIQDGRHGHQATIFTDRKHPKQSTSSYYERSLNSLQLILTFSFKRLFIYFFTTWRSLEQKSYFKKFLNNFWDQKRFNSWKLFHNYTVIQEKRSLF